MAFSIYLRTNCCGYFDGGSDSADENKKLVNSGVYSMLFDVLALVATISVAALCLNPHSSYFCPAAGYVATGLAGAILLADLTSWAAQCVKEKN
ncbi:MAG: hypothetical protein K940chlam9_00071 [Chlamydiae bacterium]|nr:hypothetical protein [Chlamydiota bacterium]